MSIRNDPSPRRSTRCVRMVSTYFGSPYGASPMSLYSPEFTRKPQYAVKAEYSRPIECGYDSWRSSVTVLPRPTPMLLVADSPTPSKVSTAADANGDGKNALAAWLTWCSANH